MTTVAELIEMLSELDPAIPVGTLVVDAGLEDENTSAIRFEKYGVLHTTVIQDGDGLQKAAWIIANGLLAPSNSHPALAEFEPETFPYRTTCNCLLALPTRNIQPVAPRSRCCSSSCLSG